MKSSIGDEECGEARAFPVRRVQTERDYARESRE